MAHDTEESLSLTLPVGTRVVTKVVTKPSGGGQDCPVGIVGVVIAAPG